MSYNWSQASAYTVSGGAQAASASPGVIFGASGWSDANGNIYSVNTNNQLSAGYAATPWQSAQLVAPPAASGVNQRGRFGIYTYSTGTGSWYSILRYSNSGGQSTGYLLGLSAQGANSYGLYINRLAAGALQGSTRAPAITIAVNTALVIELIALQISPTQTQLTANLYQSDGVTLLQTLTVIDATPALQGISGGMAILESRASGSDSHIVTTSLTTYAPAAATAYTVVLPATGAVSAPSSGSIYPNGSLSSGVNVTLSASDGGALSPDPVVLPTGSASSAPFTYTPGAAGTNTVSSSNNGGLGDPAPTTIAVYAIIAVSSAAFLFSPFNWKGDTGRGGTLWRQSWNPGAWVKIVWNASSNPTAILKINSNPSTALHISYILNGALVDKIAATGDITLSPVASQINMLQVFIRDSNGNANTRWNNGLDVLRVLGLAIDSGSSPGVAPLARPGILFPGDSITEGVGTDPGAANNVLKDYVFALMQAADAEGFDVGVSACGNNGWLHPGGVGDVPAYYSVSSGVYSESGSRWDKIDQGVSLLDTNGHISGFGATGQEPAAIVINLGTNEYLYNMSVSDMQVSIQGALGALRAAAPNAKILMLVPFGFDYAPRYGTSYPPALKAAFAAYQVATPDPNTKLIDLGTALATQLQTSGAGDQTGYLMAGSTVHPNQAGHALFAGPVCAQVLGLLTAPKVTPRFRSGFFR